MRPGASAKRCGLPNFFLSAAVFRDEGVVDEAAVSIAIPIGCPWIGSVRHDVTHGLSLKALRSGSAGGVVPE